jgi:hypothetical protein
MQHFTALVEANAEALNDELSFILDLDADVRDPEPVLVQNVDLAHRHGSRGEKRG